LNKSGWIWMRASVALVSAAAARLDNARARSTSGLYYIAGIDKTPALAAAAKG
jgi:hypothetical protein